ncbi:MAG: 4-hydroxy-3-methylbut-2-enyl diphosphate reductase, partial [Clostridia bacterium]|nr:4-hydroxy-3-methylbut-2-enyl diphosphate reductase [Clostridia bacterium]
MADIKISEYSGFCFGVKRAVDMINDQLGTSDKTVFCLGELIHNRLFNETLKIRGVKFIGVEDI